jgi:hypothetical protein
MPCTRRGTEAAADQGHLTSDGRGVARYQGPQGARADRADDGEIARFFANCFLRTSVITAGRLIDHGRFQDFAGLWQRNVSRIAVAACRSGGKAVQALTLMVVYILTTITVQASAFLSAGRSISISDPGPTTFPVLYLGARHAYRSPSYRRMKIRRSGHQIEQVTHGPSDAGASPARQRSR